MKSYKKILFLYFLSYSFLCFGGEDFRQPQSSLQWSNVVGIINGYNAKDFLEISTVVNGNSLKIILKTNNYNYEKWVDNSIKVLERYEEGNGDSYRFGSRKFTFSKELSHKIEEYILDNYKQFRYKVRVDIYDDEGVLLDVDDIDLNKFGDNIIESIHKRWLAVADGRYELTIDAPNNLGSANVRVLSETDIEYMKQQEREAYIREYGAWGPGFIYPWSRRSFGVFLGASSSDTISVAGIVVGLGFLNGNGNQLQGSIKKNFYGVSCAIAEEIDENSYGILMNLGNIIGKDVYGITLGGFGNSIGKDAYGLTLGLGNFIEKETYGLTLGGMINILKGNAYGLTLGGFGNCFEKDTYGLTLGGVINDLIKGNAYGLTLCGLGNCIEKDACGLTFGGLGNMVSKDAYGLTFGGLGNIIEEDASILTIGGIANAVLDDAWGITLAGCANYVEGSGGGLMVSGLYNYVKENFYGIQIGLVNQVGKNLIGMQIGLINKVDSSNDYPVMPIFRLCF